MDAVVPFMIEKGLFRGAYISADTAITEMLACHDYPKVVEYALSQIAILALALSNMIKYEGSFSLQVCGNGPVSLVFVAVTYDKQIRGYCVYEKDQLPSSDAISNEILFGKGQLLFSVSQIGQEPYQGVVALNQKGLVGTVKEYFDCSEQIKTELIVRQEKGLVRCLILQQMPKKVEISSEEQKNLWETVSILLNSVKNEELFNEKLHPEKLLYRLFHANELVVFNKTKPSFFCLCHKSTMKHFLDKLQPAEREALYQKNKIVTECQFCKKQYVFTREDFL